MPLFQQEMLLEIIHIPRNFGETGLIVVVIPAPPDGPAQLDPRPRPCTSLARSCWPWWTHWGRGKTADDIFKCIFLNENIWVSINISLIFVPKGWIDNIAALIQIMAWRRLGDKPLSEPMVINLLTHICVTRTQWVNSSADGPVYTYRTWIWITRNIAAFQNVKGMYI